VTSFARAKQNASITAPQDIVVVGAGIVGMSSALFLQRDGHRVTVVDPRDPGTGTSFGNAGGLVWSSCAPIGLPGVVRDVPGMLMNPHGPLSIRWSYLPRIAPWLAQLVMASRPKRVAEIADALDALNKGAGPAWSEVSQICGKSELLKPVGWLTVYETRTAFESGHQRVGLMEERGRKIENLREDEIRQLEPNLAPSFKYAYYWPDGAFLLNPHGMVDAIARAFTAEGGQLVKSNITGIQMESGKVALVTSQAGSKILVADRAVLAAGAWSKDFTRRLGVRPPLDTERGYHLMLPTPDRNLNRPTVNGENDFVLCPMETGLRLTAGVEFAGLEAPPNYDRVRGLLPDAQRMLPGLKAEERSAWLGFRPSLPDSLPVIGPAPDCPQIVCAFGHGHLGMTQGPATGRIVADMIAGRAPNLDVTPFRADRRCF